MGDENKCPECGAPVEEDRVTCPKCGYDYQRQEGGSAEKAKQRDEARQEREQRAEQRSDEEAEESQGR